MSIFKETIDPSIAKSLTLRQNLMGKEYRTSKELTFLNSKTSWVSLKSAVDVDNSSTLAKNNVLEGGTLSNGKLRYGVGINSSHAYSLQNSLGENNVLGIRPMPGITSVSIENIGAYGSTRRATITYQCWDVKQLEILEQLYMRPGYLVLLEFGRSIYLEETKGGNDLKQLIPDYDFFSRTNIVLLDELKTLYEKSVKSGGNYDAFLGYVVNYGWQIRADGGYDCKTEMISTGEVLESLKANYSLATDVNYQGIDTGASSFRGLLFPSILTTADGGIASSDLKVINQDYGSSVLLGLLREVFLVGKYSNSNAIKKYPSGSRKITVYVNKKPVDLNILPSFYVSSNNASYGKLQNGSNLNIYITLESFLNLINEVVVPISASGTKGALTKLSTRDRPYLGKADQLKCLYNTLMTSVDPDVCLIRNDEFQKVLGSIKADIVVSSIPVAPKGYESTLNNADANALRNKIVGWVTQRAKQGFTGGDNTNIVDNINEDYKQWKTKNPKKSDIEYFKYFQQVYQTVRGGVQPSITITKQIGYDRAGNPLYESEDTGPLRSWNYITDTTVVNALKNKFNTTEDIKFIDIIKGTKVGTTPDQQRIVKLLSESSNDGNLDILLTNQQKLVKTATDNAKKASETETVSQSVAKLYADYLKEIPYTFVTSLSGRKYGVIGNIYLNVKYLYKLADDASSKSQDSSGKNELLITQYITNLMKEVQACIGNVNNFELHIDDRDGVGRIIDLNYVTKEKPNFTFETGTNKSIIRDIQLESKIFSDQVSMIAISAQGDSGRLGYDNSTLVAFNKGITDRMIPKKDSPAVINEGRAIDNLISSLSGLVTNYINPYIQGYGTESSTFDAKNSGVYKDYLRDVIVFFTDKFNTDNKGSMILPTQLSFTLDGISGLVIGNLFNIDKTFVPKTYKEKNKDLGYIVVKVGHQLQDNDWTTDVTAYSFIPPSDEKITNPSNFKLVILYDPYTGAASTGISTGGGDISSSTTDFVTLCKAVINNLEGGYYHPDMLKDGRVKDKRFGTSGETMYGLDRLQGGDMNKTVQGKAFWAEIDKQNARKKWAHLYIPPDPLKTKLLDLMCGVIQPFYESWLKTYVKDQNLINLINSNGKLKFNFIYATWNGPGWFGIFSKEILTAYKKGIKDPEQLAILFVQKRINSGNSLITQGGGKITKLLGIAV